MVLACLRLLLLLPLLLSLFVLFSLFFFLCSSLPAAARPPRAAAAALPRPPHAVGGYAARPGVLRSLRRWAAAWCRRRPPRRAARWAGCARPVGGGYQAVLRSAALRARRALRPGRPSSRPAALILPWPHHLPEDVGKVPFAGTSERRKTRTDRVAAVKPVLRCDRATLVPSKTQSLRLLSGRSSSRLAAGNNAVLNTTAQHLLTSITAPPPPSLAKEGEQ